MGALPLWVPRTFLRNRRAESVLLMNPCPIGGPLGSFPRGARTGLLAFKQQAFAVGPVHCNGTRGVMHALALPILTIAWGGRASMPQRSPCRASRPSMSDMRHDPLHLSGGGDGGDGDWRAVRARLIAHEARHFEAMPGPGVNGVIAASHDEGGWVHESPLIEQGCVVLASTQQRHGFSLSQQYFHKSVMLVLSHSTDFTRGIILNRPTPFKNEEGWPLWFGGDVHSLHDDRSSREITCLHTLSDPLAERMSVKVIEGMYYTSLDCAKHLVDQGVAKPADFWTFCGYAGWGPNQLQDELDRESGSSWKLASADGGVVLRKLMSQKREGSDSDGIRTWESLMRVIGHGPSEVDASAGGFGDRMLQEWIRVNLRQAMPSPLDTPFVRLAPSIAERGATDSRTPFDIRAGDVLCAHPVIPCFTLDHQYLHKSIILLLRTGEGGCVGMILNRPSAAHVVFRATGNKRRVLFGGTLGLRDESVMWLHSKPDIGGERIGTSNLWRMSADQAAVALDIGSATPDDFILVQGVLSWSPNMLERQLAAGHFIVASSKDVPWNALWHNCKAEAPFAVVRHGEAVEEVGSPCDLATGCGMQAWAQMLENIGGSGTGARVDGDESLADHALLKWADTYLSR